MNRSRRSNWKPFAVIAVISLMTLGGVVGAGAADTDKTLKYVGSAPQVKTVFEGPASGKGYPRNLKMKVTGTSQCALDGGSRSHSLTPTNTPKRSTSSPNGHSERPGFEINSETEPLLAVSREGVNPEFAPADTATFLTGTFVKHGREVSVNFTHEVPVDGSEVGTSEPEIFCTLKAGLSLKRVK
ncbi:MAG: hypothetical protein JST08_06920 [Actinobacteria bacterium]|nr:hypothetical protein [Actinomycetota bacterium]